MTTTILRSLTAGLIFAALGSSGMAGPAAPARYDGTWNIVLVTDAGSCDQSYNFVFAVRHGATHHVPAPGQKPATISGQIGADGKVALVMQQSIATASASGQLHAHSGSGVWSLDMLGCSGRWSAQRRSTKLASGE